LLKVCEICHANFERAISTFRFGVCLIDIIERQQ